MPISIPTLILLFHHSLCEKGIQQTMQFRYWKRFRFDSSINNGSSSSSNNKKKHREHNLKPTNIVLHRELFRFFLHSEIQL